MSEGNDIAIADFNFGESETSDVVLVVKEVAFHVHKGFLAARSPYFQALFFSDFKEKDMDRIPLEADWVVFKQLMEMLYNGFISDYKFALHCQLSTRCCGDSVLTLWTNTTVFLDLADRFGVLPYAIQNLQILMMTQQCNLYAEDCYRGAAKLILALMYKMDDYNEASVSNRASVSATFRILLKAKKDLTNLIPHFPWLLDRD